MSAAQAAVAVAVSTCELDLGTPLARVAMRENARACKAVPDGSYRAFSLEGRMYLLNRMDCIVHMGESKCPAFSLFFNEFPQHASWGSYAVTDALAVCTDALTRQFLVKLGIGVAPLLLPAAVAAQTRDESLVLPVLAFKLVFRPTDYELRRAYAAVRDEVAGSLQAACARPLVAAHRILDALAAETGAPGTDSRLDRLKHTAASGMEADDALLEKIGGELAVLGIERADAPRPIADLLRRVLHAEVSARPAGGVQGADGLPDTGLVLGVVAKDDVLVLGGDALERGAGGDAVPDSAPAAAEDPAELARAEDGTAGDAGDRGGDERVQREEDGEDDGADEEVPPGERVVERRAGDLCVPVDPGLRSEPHEDDLADVAGNEQRDKEADGAAGPPDGGSDETHGV